MTAEFVQLNAQINRVDSYLVDLVGEPRDDSFALGDLALLSMESSLCLPNLVVVAVAIPSQAVEFTGRYLIFQA